MADSVNGVKENDVWKAIQHLGDPNGSTYRDIKKHLLSSNGATASQLKGLKIATAKGVNSGLITQDKNGLRYRLSNPLKNATATVKGASCKPYCSKNIRKGCRRRYACNRRRGTMPFCSKYQTKCCRRRKKSKGCKKKKKPKKKSCKKPKPKKKSCKKPKPKKKPCKKPKPKPKPC